MCECAESEKFCGMPAGKGILEEDGVKLAGTGGRKRHCRQRAAWVRQECQITQNRISTILK